MDFILVPDALAASETRYALAQRNTMGTRVGSFPVLLEALAELWLIEPSELDWDSALQEQALAMGDAFWARSIHKDEPVTVAELKAGLQFLLDYLPLDIRATEIASPANRFERYYNDLVRLYKRIGERLAQNQLAEQWLAEHQELCIEPLYVYPRVDTARLYPWQKQILDILTEKGWLAPEPEKYRFIPEPAPAHTGGPIQQFSQRLFHPEAHVIPCEGLYWLTCRDQVQEVEAATSMIQVALDQGTAAERIVVVVPRGSDYELWLEKHFAHAGIIASNVRSESATLDWQSSLIHDLLTSLLQPDVPMARMSVMINPLMPWFSDQGHRLAEQFGDGRTPELKPESPPEQRAMLDLLLNLPEQTPIAVVEWLTSIVGQCRTPKIKGLGKQRLKSLLDNARRLLSLYSDQPFEEQIARVVQQIPVAALESQEDRVRYLHAINIIQDGEPLPFQLDELFVLGFNQGHYSYQSEHTGPIPRGAWDQIASRSGLAIPSVEASQQHWQERFAEMLSRANTRITFLRALNDFQGERLEASESLLDMALCFQPLEDLAPGRLECPLMQSDHPLLRTETIPIEQPEEPELADLQFDGQLLNSVRIRGDGTPKPESPSSLEKLMQSPLAWLLHRLNIKSRVWEPQTPEISVQGTVAHKVFELFRHRQGEPWSEPLFDDMFSQAMQEEAPFLDASQWTLKRTQLRQSVYRALASFASWCKQENWTITDAELELQGQLWGIPVRGFVDAVLSNGQQSLIVDYKKSKHDRRLKQLDAGYDLQTLIYRELYQQQNPTSEVLSGYYTLNDSTLLADQALNPGDQLAVVHPAPPLQDQSTNAVALVQERLGEISSGLLRLNQTNDEKTWDNRGINAYALTDNPVVSRFTRSSEEGAA